MAISGKKEENLDIQSIVAELKNELARIGTAIGLLEGTAEAPPRKRRGRPPASAAGKAQPEGRGSGLTPAGRRKLSEAMKRRWAQRRSAKVAPKATTSGELKKRGGMTAAGRKKVSEATKTRS